jgi:rhomboid protease GluP
MAFGFTPKHAVDLSLDSLTHQQFLVTALDIAKELEWDVRYISETGLMAISTAKMFKWKSKITIRIEEDMVNIKSESIGSEMMDLGKNKKVVDRFSAIFYERRTHFSPEELAVKYEELAPKLVPPEQDVLSRPPATTKEKAGSFFSLFIPREGYFITPLLVDLNIGIFILMILTGVNAFLPDNLSLVKWGANFRPVTLQGEWWRLITCCFLHIGVFHLLFNMYALLYIGLLLEPYLGKLRFAVAYLLTGVIASLTSLYWHDATISAGASGAIFGMYGVFLAMLTTNFVEKTTRKALLVSIAVFVVYNLLNGLKGGVDNAAHIGGLVSGFIIGYIYYPGLRKPENAGLLYTTTGAAALLVLATSFVVYNKMPNDLPVYQQQMKLFARMERRALRIYRMPKDTPKEKWLSVIKDTGIYYWNENIKLLEGVERLKVPESVKGRMGTLIDYCNLRIVSYNYLYKRIEEDAGPEKDSLNYYNSQIKEILDKLKGE